MRPRIAAALLAAIATLVSVEVLVPGSPAGVAGAPAPELPRELLSGQRVDLASLRGRPALINFWASWCAPCRQESPLLERIAEMGHRGPKVVGVDWNDSPRNARAFIHSLGLRYSILRDPSGVVGERYGINGLPTTFILDPEGRIATVLRGPQTSAGFRAALRSARSG